MTKNGILAKILTSLLFAATLTVIGVGQENRAWASGSYLTPVSGRVCNDLLKKFELISRPESPISPDVLAAVTPFLKGRDSGQLLTNKNFIRMATRLNEDLGPQVLVEMFRWYHWYFSANPNAVRSYMADLWNNPQGRAYFKDQEKKHAEMAKVVFRVSAKSNAFTDVMAANQFRISFHYWLLTLARFDAQILPESTRLEIIKSLILSTPIYSRRTLLNSRALEQIPLISSQMVDILSGVETAPDYDPLQADAHDPYSYDLPPERYLTYYTDYLQIFNSLHLKPGDRVEEWGAAFGRGLMVLHTFFPQVEYVGYEIVPERLEQARAMAKEFGLGGTLKNADVLDARFNPAPADYVFMYNPKEFNPITVNREKLQAMALQKAKQNRKVVLVIILERPLTAEEKTWLKPMESPKGLRLIRDRFRFYEVVP